MREVQGRLTNLHLQQFEEIRLGLWQRLACEHLEQVPEIIARVECDPPHLQTPTYNPSITPAPEYIRHDTKLVAPSMPRNACSMECSDWHVRFNESPHLLVQHNAGRHEQLAKLVDVNPPRLIESKVDA